MAKYENMERAVGEIKEIYTRVTNMESMLSGLTAQDGTKIKLTILGIQTIDSDGHRSNWSLTDVIPVLEEFLRSELPIVIERSKRKITQIERSVE